jgi:hypothetical protein
MSCMNNPKMKLAFNFYMQAFFYLVLDVKLLEMSFSYPSLFFNPLFKLKLQLQNREEHAFFIHPWKFFIYLFYEKQNSCKTVRSEKANFSSSIFLRNKNPFSCFPWATEMTESAKIPLKQWFPTILYLRTSST